MSQEDRMSMGRSLRFSSIPVFCLLAVAAAAPAQADSLLKPKSVDQAPRQLAGTWYVSLCANSGHCWIRFQNETTGEVHTLGRYNRGAGARFSRDGEILQTSAVVAGLQWDHELVDEGWVSKGKFVLLTVKRTDPAVFIGDDGGKGYHVMTQSCVTFARDAWNFYAGEQYALPLMPMPRNLAEEIGKRHPEVPLRERMSRN
jgi:hypothetical protein